MRLARTLVRHGLYNNRADAKGVKHLACLHTLLSVAALASPERRDAVYSPLLSALIFRLTCRRMPTPRVTRKLPASYLARYMAKEPIV